MMCFPFLDWRVVTSAVYLRMVSRTLRSDVEERKNIETLKALILHLDRPPRAIYKLHTESGQFEQGEKCDHPLQSAADACLASLKGSMGRETSHPHPVLSTVWRAPGRVLVPHLLR